MAYPYQTAFYAETAGRTFTASLRELDGTAAATQPTFTVVDEGDGFYAVHCADMPAGHRGRVRVLEGATIVAVAVVEPRESENADVLTSEGILDEALADHLTDGTVGHALQLARAGGIWQRSVSADELFIYDVDGVTLLATLPLTPSGGPFTSSV